MLKQVTARNWRAFDAVDVELRPGVNVVLGPNGAGKTSLLEAAAFALAGTPSVLPDARQMIRTDGQPVDVSLTVEVDGAACEISRALGPAGRRGAETLSRGGVTTAEGGERVAAALEALLGVPCDFFLRILYMPEGDVYRFLDKPPLAALDAHLRRVLGLEQVALIDQAAARVKRELAHERANLMTLAEQVTDHTRALAEGRSRWSGDSTERHRWLGAERDRLTRAQREAAQRTRAAVDAAHAGARRVDELAKLDREHAALATAGDPAAAHAAARADCARLQASLSRLERDLAEATAQQKVLADQRRALAARAPAELAADDAPLRALLAQVDVAREAREAALATAAAEQQAAVERDRTLRRRAPADLLADDPDLRASRDARAARLRAIDDALATAAAERQGTRESADFLASHAPGAGAEPTCPVCRQPLPEPLRRQLLDEYAARDTALAERISALQAERAAEVAAGEAEARALHERLLAEAAARAAAAAERVATLRGERDEQARALAAAADAVRQRLLAAHDAGARALAERIAALGGERQEQAAALEAAERREGEATMLRRRLDDLAARRQTLLPSDATPESLTAERDRLVADETAAREAETALAEELDAVRQEAAALQGYLELAAMEGRSPDDLAAARAALARRELLAELFATATAAALRQLREGALADAYGEVERAWADFIGWTDARVEPQAKGRLAVRRGGRSLDLAQLSGGERAAFLALLHAHLGRRFGRGGFLLLDEPLEHLDAANGRKLLQHLVRACAEGKIAQIVIATVEADVVRAAIRDGEAHVITLPLGGAGGA
ncbi:MAG TPA: AAA family ATPase [Chloroflexota bacterium]|jgi:DNA repair exonuclease SbcCD ATPase subunit